MKPLNVTLPDLGNKPIQAEIPDVQALIFFILNSFNKIFESLKHFQSRPHSTHVNQSVYNGFKGRPDHLLCRDGEILAFVEDKTTWDLPYDKALDLLQMWEEDKIELTTIANTTRKSVKEIVEQCYGYLSHNNLRYGMLTCYNVSYFLERPCASTLMISNPIYYDDTNPTLLQCLYYLYHLAIKDHKSPEVSPHEAKTYKRFEHFSDEYSDHDDSGSDYGRRRRPAKRTKRPNTLKSKSISKVRY
jgi:hypothetical protein